MPGTVGTIKRRHQTVIPDGGQDVSKNVWNDSLVVAGAAVDGAVMQRDSTQTDGWSFGPTAGGSTRGTFASRPAAGTPGNLYIPSDGIAVYRDNGTFWDGFGPVLPLVEPIDANYSWVNQGVATKDTTRGGVYLAMPSGTDGVFHGRFKSLPGSTPWTIDVAMMPNLPLLNFATCGVGWRLSSTGALIMMDWGYNTGLGWSLQKFSNNTTFVSNYATTVDPQSYAGSRNTNAPPPEILFVRLQDDGVNRKVSISPDGSHWNLIHTVSDTDFITPDQVGFVIQTDQSFTLNAGVWLLSWYEH